MLRFARIGVYLGVILVVLGLVTGFGALFTDLDDLAIMLLRLVPLGFVLGFAGLAVLLLLGPRD